jgi:hypothetical protein
VTEAIGSFSGVCRTVRLRRGVWRYDPVPDRPLTFTRPSGEKVVVDEKALTTDRATIPRIFWWWLAPNDIEQASVVHDAIYERHHRGVDSHGFREANRILAEGCRAEGCSRLTCWLVRKACDWFGGRIWRRGLDL